MLLQVQLLILMYILWPWPNRKRSKPAEMTEETIVTFVIYCSLFTCA